MSSWWRFFEVHHLLSVVTPPVLAYYSNYVIGEHADALLIWCIFVLELTVGTLTAFLCLARCGTAVPESGSGPPRPCESGILVPPLVRIHKAFKTFGVMSVLRETGFDISLYYMQYCRSQFVHWSCCSSKLFPDNFKLGEVSKAPSHNLSSYPR